jgi:peroxiredoxin
MLATVNCPQCHAALEMPDELPAGKRLQCPDCGAAFTPPRTTDRTSGLKAAQNGAESRGAAAAAGPRRRPHPDDEDDDRELPRHRTKGGSIVLLAGVLLIALVALGVGGMVVVGFLQMARSEAVEAAQPMPPPAPVVVAGPVGPGMAPMAPMAPVGPGMGGGMMGGMAAAPQPMPKPGAPAPEIQGTDLDGKPMKLSDCKGKVVFLDFWGEWCPHCRTMYNYQNQLINRMKGRDFVLLGVNSDDNEEIARAVVKNNNLGWRSWHDGGGPVKAGPIAQSYGVADFPTSFIIDRNGVVQKVHVGVTAEVLLDRNVDEVMAAGENRPAGAPPRWQPGSVGFGQLGDEVAVGAYRVRPPKGYFQDKRPPEVGREVYRWEGPAPPGGNPPVFEVSLSPSPPERDLRALLEKELEVIPGPRRLGWNCGPAERGELNGLVFLRAQWSIQEQAQKWTGAGVIYLGLDGNTLVRISCRDFMPKSGGPLDAAPLTFHRAAQ